MDVHSIMLVDDNPIDLFVHERLLVHNGLGEKIIKFSNAIEALEHLKTHLQHANEIPDVILLDIMMPELTGFDFLKRYEKFMQKLIKTPRIFMLSSSENEEDIKMVHENPLVEHLLQKPLLVATLQRYL